jgi:hypothetical protein
VVLANGVCSPVLLLQGGSVASSPGCCTVASSPGGVLCVALPLCIRTRLEFWSLGLLRSSGGGDYEGFVKEPTHPKPLLLTPFCVSFRFAIGPVRFRNCKLVCNPYSFLMNGRAPAIF